MSSIRCIVLLPMIRKQDHNWLLQASKNFSRIHLVSAPNNSFKPNALRSTNNMAGRACHVVGSATHVGLTQALGPMTSKLGIGWKLGLAAILLLMVGLGE